MDRSDRAISQLRAGQAILLGLIQGPSELLPISSSAHTTLIPWLCGWEYTNLDPGMRRSFEIVLHGGALAGMLLDPRGRELARGPHAGKEHYLYVALALVPPAICGYLLERRTESEPSMPTIAGGLMLVGLLMAVADRKQEVRDLEQMEALDGLLLGVAQAFALMPGVSRNGATLALARWRGFTRESSRWLSWKVGLPVILGATALRVRRLLQAGLPAGSARAFGFGALAAFLSTRASMGILSRRRSFALLPFAAYRWILGLFVIAKALRRRMDVR